MTAAPGMPSTPRHRSSASLTSTARTTAARAGTSGTMPWLQPASAGPPSRYLQEGVGVPRARSRPLCRQAQSFSKAVTPFQDDIFSPAEIIEARHIRRKTAETRNSRMPKVIALKNPIATHDGEKREITLRDPIGADYAKMKRVPLKVSQDKDGNASMEVDYDVAIRWLSALSGIDDILIGKLQRTDFIAAVGALNDHLMAEGDTPGN